MVSRRLKKKGGNFWKPYTGGGGSCKCFRLALARVMDIDRRYEDMCIEILTTFGEQSPLKSEQLNSFAAFRRCLLVTCTL